MAQLVGRRAVCVGLGSALLSAGCQRPPEPPELPAGDAPTQLSVERHGSGASAVVEARWAAAVAPDGRVDAARARTLLEAAIAELTGSRAPWGEWASVGRRIAIKVNAITCQAFTHPELAGAIARGLVDAGARAERVVVWDRDSAGLVARGYRLDATGAGGYRCLGSDSTAAGSRSRAISIARSSVHLAPTLLDADLLVSAAALKDHSMAGVSLCLKNNFGMVWGAELLHGDVRAGSGCEPAISELAASAEVRGRLGLCVLDALVGVCQGGPGPAQPRHVFRHAGVLVSRDPAAIDRRGLEIIEARRARLGLEPLAQRRKPNPSPPVHIDNAASRLGA